MGTLDGNTGRLQQLVELINGHTTSVSVYYKMKKAYQ